MTILSAEPLVYYDISPEVSDKTAVFPGDSPYRRTVALDFAHGDHLTLSSLQTTVHIGAHADAPSHYHPKGQDIGRRSLDYYLGPCQVVTVRLPRGRRIMPADVDMSKLAAPRVIFNTGSFPDPNVWNNDFNALSPELIEALAKRKVVLVGIDTPSIDPENSKALESHQAVYRHDMAVLEGLTLEGVPDGVYNLVALPLRLKGADASPVRAILLKQAAG